MSMWSVDYQNAQLSAAFVREADSAAREDHVIARSA
jgi:hypothetical protein